MAPLISLISHPSFSSSLAAVFYSLLALSEHTVEQPYALNSSQYQWVTMEEYISNGAEKVGEEAGQGCTGWFPSSPQSLPSGSEVSTRLEFSLSRYDLGDS